MKDTLTYNTKTGSPITLSVIGKDVYIKQGDITITTFLLEEVWDLVRNEIATLPADPYSPRLFRRKREALAAIKSTMDWLERMKGGN